MRFVHLIGQKYRRPGSPDTDIWEVTDIRRESGAMLVELNSQEDESIKISIHHLREPFWRNVGDFTDIE